MGLCSSYAGHKEHENIVHTKYRKASVDAFGDRIKAEFSRADHDNSGTIDFSEFKKLIVKLNIRCPTKQLKSIFKRANTENDGHLRFEEFSMTLKMLNTMPDLSIPFEKYSIDGQMTADQLVKFYKMEQGETVLSHQMSHIIRIFTNGKDTLRYSDFASIVANTTENLITKNKAGEVYQDMTKPLSNYYISSSHNSYLSGDQLTSKSAVEPIIRALKIGCRVIELDCYDGKEAPIIHHAKTLTSTLSFEDAIRAIGEAAFTASPYPVIITLENHCGPEQQKIQVRVLKEILGDVLYHSSEIPQKYLSPEELQGKILIRDKPGKIPELEELIYIRNIKCKDLTQQDDLPGVTSSSRSEKCISGFQKDSADIVRYCKNHLARVYPAGKRVDSSNYNPMVPWASGCQIVALNFQGNALPMWVNQGRFTDNGASGYVLKPKHLLEDAEPEPTSPVNNSEETVVKKASFKIMSARYLPKPKEATKGEIIDPFVTVVLSRADGTSEEQRTKTIPNNGFDPDWNEEFSFDITNSDLEIVSFIVWDADKVGKDFIGQYSVSVKNLCRGYRRVPLLNRSGIEIESSYIMVKCSLE